MKKILIVDDEQDMLELFRIRLNGQGYNLLTACDGEQGLQIARLEKPDIIILDLMMPKLDGFSVCKTLKSDIDYKHIPIVLLTARIDAVESGLASGADAYITKPFDWDELKTTVENFLAGT